MGGGVLALLLSSPGAQSSEGSLQAESSSLEPLGVQPFPMWGAFPFIVQGEAPIYIYLALCLGTVGVPFVPVSHRGPLGRSGVGRFDPGDLLGRRVVQVLSHPRPVGAAWSVGWPLGDYLQSCPPRPTSLVCRASPCLPCVAPASGTACLVRGALSRSGRGCPVTLAGVMGWCTGATIITTREGTSVNAPPPVVSWGPRGRHYPFVREPCSLCLRRKIRGAVVMEPAQRPSLTGTPVREGGCLGAHDPGHTAWL